MRAPPFLAAALLAACAATPEAPTPEAPTEEGARREVRETELAFAATMAARDHDAFTSFLSTDAVFFTGAGGVLRGRAAVAAAWKPYFDGPAAPFSWEPDTVEALASGDLALSTGPVTGPDGARLGRFVSIWRREADRWRIVFDRGED